MPAFVAPVPSPSSLRFTTLSRPPGPTGPSRPAIAVARHPSFVLASAVPDQPPPSTPPTRAVLSRREVLQAVFGAVVAGVAGGFSALEKARAAVDFDVDKYGDKELKVSTINRIKQTYRTLFQSHPDLLPLSLELALHDALTYTRSSSSGGPDGSLRLELSYPSNAHLASAFSRAVEAPFRGRLAGEAMREVSYADLIAFGGAVAVEVTGGPKMRVQLGREDGKNARGEGVAFPRVFGGEEEEEGGKRVERVKEALERAGLDPVKDLVLIYGVLGALQSIAENRMRKMAEMEGETGAEEGEDLTYGEYRDVGRAGSAKGAAVVSSDVRLLVLAGDKLDNGFVKAVAEVGKKEPEKLRGIDRAVWEDAKMRSEVVKYAGNSKQFLNDFADLYEKIMLLGSRYESSKMLDGQ